MVGTTRFELATSWPPAKRATKLRHVPAYLLYQKHTIKKRAEALNFII